MGNKGGFRESKWVMCHQIELTSAEVPGNSFVLKRIPVQGSWYLQKQKDIKFGGSFRENQELEIFLINIIYLFIYL